MGRGDRAPTLKLEISEAGLTGGQDHEQGVWFACGVRAEAEIGASVLPVNLTPPTAAIALRIRPPARS
jgi:hypothetical protein